MTRINDAIDMLKQKHSISVREHLGFGNFNHSTSLLEPLGFGNAANCELKVNTYKYGYKYIGELNSNNEHHGKGIMIYTSGNISIGYWNNGLPAPGNYFVIKNDGEFLVGEFYSKEGKKWRKGTEYHTDGKQIKYDYTAW